MPLNYIEVLHDSCLHTAWHGVCEPIVHTSTSCARPFPPSPRRLEHKANWLTNMDKLVLCFVPLVAALGRAAQHERLTACLCAKLVRAAAVAALLVLVHVHHPVTFAHDFGCCSCLFVEFVRLACCFANRKVAAFQADDNVAVCADFSFQCVDEVAVPLTNLWVPARCNPQPSL